MSHIPCLSIHLCQGPRLLGIVIIKERKKERNRSFRHLVKILGSGKTRLFLLLLVLNQHHDLYLGNSLDSTSDGEDTVVDTLDHLGDASLDTGLIAEIGNVLASLADNDTSLLGRDEGTKGQGSSGIVLLTVLVLMILFIMAVKQRVVGGLVVRLERHDFFEWLLVVFLSEGKVR